MRAGIAIAVTEIVCKCMIWHLSGWLLSSFPTSAVIRDNHYITLKQQYIIIDKLIYDLHHQWYHGHQLFFALFLNVNTNRVSLLLHVSIH